MKKCEEVLELLSLYIDNELDDETARAVEEHVEMCSSCKTELKQLSEIVKICNELDEVELPDGFNEVLHQKLILEKKRMEKNKKIIFTKRIMKTIASAAAIFILIFAARGFMNKEFKILSNKDDLPITKMESMDNFSSSSTEPDDQMMSANLRTDAENKIFGSTEDEKGLDAHSHHYDRLDTGDNSNENVNMNSHDNIAVASGSIATDTPSNAPNDEKGTWNLKELDEPNESMSSVDLQFNESIEPIISLTAYSNNFESDILKINEIASKFGTQIKESIVIYTQPNSEKDFIGGEIMGFGSTNEDYVVSYSMDKLSYEKFIKEINDKFKGKYNVTNDKKALNKRLKDIEESIRKLENSKLVDTDEYRSLIYEKEVILKELYNISSGEKIKIHITIVRNN